MGIINRSAIETMRHPYMKKGFWNRLENRFWHYSESYSIATRERMDDLVNGFFNPKHIK